jgi:hypothetical protein
MDQSFDLHSANCLQCFRSLSTRQLVIWIFISFVTVYPVPWLHFWLIPFTISLRKYSLLYFCLWGK